MLSLHTNITRLMHAHQARAMLRRQSPKRQTQWVLARLLGEVADGIVVGVGEEVGEAVVHARVLFRPVHEPRPMALHLVRCAHRAECDLAEHAAQSGTSKVRTGQAAKSDAAHSAQSRAACSAHRGTVERKPQNAPRPRRAECDVGARHAWGGRAQCRSSALAGGARESAVCDASEAEA